MRLKLKKILLTALVVASVCSIALSVPASAAGSVIDCRQLSYIQVGSNRYSFQTWNVAQADAQLAYYFGSNAVGYKPVQSDGSDVTFGDYEMHFDIGTEISKGDTYTLTYDMFFPENFNSNSQLVMPGFDFSYIASVNGRWETVPVHGVSVWHWQGSATVTAGFSTTDITIIPRGLKTGEYVIVNTLKVSIAGKDYSGAINSTKDEIKANADKNASEIKDNQDKNTQKQIDEDYGYEKPDSSETDEGISSGTNLIESLNKWIDDFNEELPTSVSHIMDDIQPFKQVVHKIFNIFPVALQYLFTFAMVFLVLRKVVGR